MRSLVHLLFLGFGLFYFFLDGDRFVAFLRDISPFEPHHTRAFFHEFESVAWAKVSVRAVGGHRRALGVPGLLAAAGS